MSLNINQEQELINKTFIDSDLKIWKEETEIINLEIVFYESIVNKKIQELDSNSDSNYQNLIGDLKDLKTENIVFENNCIEYKNRVSGIAECEDLYCETYFLNEHVEFKQKIEKHFSNFITIKSKLFSYLKINSDS